MAKEKTLSLKAFLDTFGFSKSLNDMKKQMDQAGKDFLEAASEAHAFGTKTDELKNKAKYLNDVIGKQTDYVEMLKTAHEKAAQETGADSKATIKLGDELQKAKIRYNNLHSELKGVNKAIEDNEKDLKNVNKALDLNEKELKDNTRALDDNGDKVKKSSGGWADWIKGGLLAGGTAGFISKAIGFLGSGLSNIGGAAGGAFGAIKAGASAALGVVETLAKATESMVMASSSAADDAMTMGAKMGLTAQQVQELQYASELVDVDLETMAGSLSRLTMGVGKASKEQTDYNKKLSEFHKHHTKIRPVLGDTANAFKTLKVPIIDGKGALRDMNDVWADTITALGKVKNETNRDILAQKLFGKSFAELKPLVAAGGKALKDLAKEARANGYVMSNEQLEALGGLDDSYQRYIKTLDGVRNFMSSALAPSFTAFFDEIVKDAPALEKDLTPAMEDLGTAIGEAAKEIVPQLPGLLKTVPDLISSIAGGIKEATPYASTILEKVPGIIDGISGALKNVPEGTMSKFGDLAVNGFSAMATAAVTCAPSLTSIITSVANNSEGLTEIITTAAEKAPGIVESLANMAENVLPKVAENGAKAVESFASLLSSLISVYEWVMTHDVFWSNLTSGWGIGGDLLGLNPKPAEKKASGGVTHGGITLVGERGPEPVILPRGSRVVSNNEARQLLGSGGQREVHHSGTIRHEIVGADGVVQYIKEQIIDEMIMEVRMT